MKEQLNNWLQQQRDIEAYFVRFLKNNEFSEELNTVFESGNCIPIAMTGVGGIIYAEVFGGEVLFSIYYNDQRLDFHLADSIKDFEALLQKADSRDYYLHIAQCDIGTHDVETFNKTSLIPGLINAFGPLKSGEIYGYSDAIYEEITRPHTVSHWLSARYVEKTAICNAKDYFLKALAQRKRYLSEHLNRYDDIHDNRLHYLSELFFNSNDLEEDLLQYPATAIKSIYKGEGEEVLPNLRSISNSEFTYVKHTNRLVYFKCTSSFITRKADTFLSLLQHNHGLLDISITDTMDHERFGIEKGVIHSFEALSSFPLLRSFKLNNFTVAQFPDELTNLKNLEALSLIKTGTNNLPSSVANMARLEELHLSEGNLDGMIGVITELKQLRILTLHRCGLRSLPESFKQLTGLEYLDLSANPLTEIPEWINELKNLKILNVSSCGLTNLPALIAELPAIERLELKGNDFTALPKSLLKLKSKVALEPKFKALYDEKVRQKLEKDGMKPANFTDFNFKLLVIQSLMYDKELLKPKFDVWKFKESYTGRDIDIEEEGYDMIPEVKAYFEALEIPTIMLDEIDELNGAMDVYQEISPMWGGEDDYYDLKSVKDVKLLPNLKKIRVDGLLKKSLASKLETLGIEVDER